MTKIDPPKGWEPFRFYTRLNLVELTGRKAKNLKELVTYLKTASDSVIYHHTHHFLAQHQSLTPEPPNDFVHWATVALNEVELGEKLASINTIEFSNLHDLRDKIVSSIESFLERSPGRLREANEGQEFHFLKTVSFIFPTAYVAASLEEFASVLEKVTIDSLYFHMFEARISHAKGTNDFSLWLEKFLGEKELAKKIAGLDPYTNTIEELRTKIIKLVKFQIEKNARSPAES